MTAYRQLQHDTTGQLYSVTGALRVPQTGTLDAALRQLKELGYDFTLPDDVSAERPISSGQAAAPRANASVAGSESS